MATSCEKQFALHVGPSIPDPYGYWPCEDVDDFPQTVEDVINGNNFGVTGSTSRDTGKVDFGRLLHSSTAVFNLNNVVGLAHVGDGFTIAGWFLNTNHAFGFLEFTPMQLRYETAGGANMGQLTVRAKFDNTPSPDPFYVELEITPQAPQVGETIQTPATLTDEAWHFFRAWFDPDDGKVRLQVDNGTIIVSTGTFTFAVPNRGDINVERNDMNFTADEMGYWKEVLTAGQAAQLWNSGNGRTYPFT